MKNIMRSGNNPEKYKGEKNILKRHRVVVVFYIPLSEAEYFKELDLVLDKCLFSLTKTIDSETTALTIINNNSAPHVQSIVDKYKHHIDKYVVYSENKGKVYAVLNEVRGINEEFVTISDADILFFNGWEKAVFDVFSNHPRAGVVSPHPCPYTTFHFNQSVFGLNSLRNNIGYGKNVSDDDIDLYIKGTDLPKIIHRRMGKYDWREKQYILKKPVPAVIGAYHVVSTYRTIQFRNIYHFPEIKFKNSYESEFIDCLADKKGMFRLSTVQSYIYHMGNKLDDVAAVEYDQNNFKISAEFLQAIRPFLVQKKFHIMINRIIGRIFIKFKWNK
jgi:hypothetical protein